MPSWTHQSLKWHLTLTQPQIMLQSSKANDALRDQKHITTSDVNKDAMAGAYMTA